MRKTKDRRGENMNIKKYSIKIEVLLDLKSFFYISIYTTIQVFYTIAPSIIIYLSHFIINFFSHLVHISWLTFTKVST